MIKRKSHPASQSGNEWAILTGTGWLALTDSDFQQAVLARAIIKDVDATEALSFAGDEAGSVWGIVAGQVDFTSGVSAPDAPMCEIGLPGDWWGFRPLRGGSRAIHAVARTPITVATVGLTQMNALLNEVPGWWRHIALLNALKHERWGNGMVDLTLRDSRLRCIAVLLRLAGCRSADNDDKAVTIHFTQEQLAAAANMSRYPVGVILKDLTHTGHLSTGYGTITILRAGSLRAMIDQS